MARRLSAEERAALEALAGEGLGAERIGRALGRCASTVRRELARGGGRDRYRAADAQADADARAARPRASKLGADPELAAEAAEMLAMGWSPHAVAAQWRAEGRCAERRVCAETIYAACYDPRGRRGLGAGSWRHLARRRRRRKPRGRFEQAKRGPLGDIRPLSERPAAASERSEAGHWEGDLIIGERNRSAVVTLVERVTRQTLLAALPSGYDAPSVASAVAAALARQPRHLVRTLTWDTHTGGASSAEAGLTRPGIGFVPCPGSVGLFLVGGVAPARPGRA